MKYLNKLFALDNRQSCPQSSAATLTSSLYSVTFTPESSIEEESKRGEQQLLASTSSAKISFNKRSELHRIDLIAQASSGEPAAVSSWEDQSIVSLIDNIKQKPRAVADKSSERVVKEEEEVEVEVEVEEEELGEVKSRGVLGYLLSATIGYNSIADKQYDSSTNKSKTSEQNWQQLLDSNRKSQIRVESATTEDDDWILVGEDLAIDPHPPSHLHHHHHPSHHHHHHHHHHHQAHNKNFNTTTTIAVPKHTTDSFSKAPLTQLKQMALEKPDIELIKGSWIPVRKDTTASGVLLFKGLFIKFPQYLKFFPQFLDLDLERMHENKRLLRHAVKVIETVTFVVDALGDDSKTSLLNESLAKLVKSHLKRRIGLAEFRNLGIVLIDFICDVVGRGGAPSVVHQKASNDDEKCCASESSNANFSSNDSETMTIALDKLRASSSPSSSCSEEESYLSPQSSGASSGLLAQSAVANNNLTHDISGSNEFAKSEESNAGANKQQDGRVIGGGSGCIDSGGCSSIGGSSSISSSNVSNSTKTSSSSSSSSITNNKAEPKIDTNLHLVAAWTKLYNIILDLVKQEEAEAEAAAVDAAGE